MPTPSRLVIRHHHVVLHSAKGAPRSANPLPVTLGDVIYLGDRVRSTLTLSPDISLISEGISGPSAGEVGTSVLAELSPEHCIVI